MKKTKLILITAIFASWIGFHSSALAQNNTSATATTANTNTSTAVAADVSSSTEAAAPKLKVGYTAVMAGPGLNMSKAKAADGSDFFISHRPKIGVAINKNLDMGLQFRIRTTNTTVPNMGVTNENYRLYSTLKKVATYNSASLTLIPRIVLPTSNGSHNTHMAPSPELIASFDIEPKDSIFTFSIAPQIIGLLYHSNKALAGSTLVDFILNLESTMALNDQTKMTFGLYPEYKNFRGQGFAHAGNEFDLGVSYDFAKGWSVNPYLGSDVKALTAGGNVAANTSINLTLSGSIL